MVSSNTSPLKVVTMVGTSLFDNLIEIGIEKSKWQRLEKRNDSYRVFNNWDGAEQSVNKLKGDIINAINSKVTNKKDDKKIEILTSISAEFTSIYRIMEETKRDLSVYLLSSDTILSPLAAKIVKEIFEKNGGLFPLIKEVVFEAKYFPEDPHGCVIQGLHLNVADKFLYEGLPGILKKIDAIAGEGVKSEARTKEGKKTATKDRDKYEGILLNITGGYKVLIPYLTIFGQIFNLPLYYIYEGSDTLLEVPQVPVDFDYLMVEDSFTAFELLNPKSKNPTAKKDEFLKEINDDKEFLSELLEKNILREIDDDSIGLDIIGELLYRKYRFHFEGREWHRWSMLGNLVEMKLYEYFVNKHIAEGKRIVSPSRSVLSSGGLGDLGDDEMIIEHSKKIKSASGEIDVYIEDKEKVWFIEVKPAGQPIFYGEKNTIEAKITKKDGIFQELLNKCNEKGKKVEFLVYLYSHKEPSLENIKRNIGRLYEKLQNENHGLIKNESLIFSFKWYHIQVDNLKKNFDWKIDKDAHITEIEV